MESKGKTIQYQIWEALFVNFGIQLHFSTIKLIQPSTSREQTHLKKCQIL